MAALSNQTVLFKNAGTGKDCNIMMKCLSQLGVNIVSSNDGIQITGANG